MECTVLKTILWQDTTCIGRFTLHPDAKSYEIMIQQFFKRYAQVRNIEVFEPLLNGELSNKDFYLMDEHRMFYGFQQALEM